MESKTKTLISLERSLDIQQDRIWDVVLRPSVRLVTPVHVFFYPVLKPGSDSMRKMNSVSRNKLLTNTHTQNRVGIRSVCGNFRSSHSGLMRMVSRFTTEQHRPLLFASPCCDTGTAAIGDAVGPLQQHNGHKQHSEITFQNSRLCFVPVLKMLGNVLLHQRALFHNNRIPNSCLGMNFGNYNLLHPFNQMNQ